MGLRHYIAFVGLTSLACGEAPEGVDPAAVDAQWQRLSRCLVGEPLAADEKPSQRMRDIELRYLLYPPPKTAWPTSCQPAAKALVELLDRAEAAAPLDSPRRKLRSELRVLDGADPAVFLHAPGEGQPPTIDVVYRAAA
ncbi:MAG: hypothetical protein AAGA56_24655, partial [Myxococcota bacterium]